MHPIEFYPFFIKYQVEIIPLNMAILSTSEKSVALVVYISNYMLKVALPMKKGMVKNSINSLAIKTVGKLFFPCT